MSADRPHAQPGTPGSSPVASPLDEVQRAAQGSALFAAIERHGDLLRCRAAESAAEAWYRVLREDGRWFVELVTPDRWLSESIEADLMHHGDPIEELVDEELSEIESERGGEHEGEPVVQHYRSPDLLYTFRTPASAAGELADSARIVNLLLAYEAAFRELGDMSAGPDPE